MPLDFDPNHSAAVLIGTSRFPRDNELPAIPQVVANVIDFERILSDPAFVGLPLDHITRLLDPDSAAFAAEALAEVAQGTTDLLLIYYAGHGLVSRKAELILTVETTTRDRAEANGLRWETLREFIRDSPAQKKVVILDCCFSGRAAAIMAPEEEAIREELAVGGTIVLCSSPRNSPSFAPPGHRRTAFTDAFVSTIERGLDSGRDTLTVDEIFGETRRRLKADGYPDPQRALSETAADIALVANTRYGEPGDATAFDHVIRRIESRVDAFLSEKLGGADTGLELYEPDETHRMPLVVRMTAVYAGVFAVAGEVALLWLLGKPTRQYNSNSETYTFHYPNIVPFLLAACVLGALSAAMAFLSISSLRNRDTPTFLRFFLSRPRSIRLVLRLSALNFLVVLLTMLLAPLLGRIHY